VKRWELTLERCVFGPPSVGSDGTVYCGSTDGRFRAVDGKTGKVKWSFLTGNSAGIAPAIGSDGVVYVGSEDHRLYAIK
jgi:outer membrane protein assembly factor BamB